MSITLVRNDEGFDVLEDNKRIGYVEGGKLYGFGNSGYAELVGTVDHSSEISPKLKIWLNEQQQKELEL